ncbi:MAG: DUF2500 domain-containing protein [Angelakisella sp.]|nr:DUF2500 domain-containing protein [Angelakisella sp.]
MNFGFSFINALFPFMFFTIFAIVIVTFIVTAVRGVGQWNRNNNSPVLTVDASIVAKRTQVSHHHHNNGSNMHHSSSSTRYYVTFEVESGDRMELPVSGYEYGMLVEGDRGRLTFQGTRYQGFVRQN